jgi:hypothetical protein
LALSGLRFIATALFDGADCSDGDEIHASIAVSTIEFMMMRIRIVAAPLAVALALASTAAAA